MARKRGRVNKSDGTTAGGAGRPPRFASADAFPVVGFGVCRVCREATPPGRRYWCGAACVGVYLALRCGDGLRRLLFERDCGVCRGCGLDCTFLETVLLTWKRSKVPKVRAFYRACRAELGVPAARRTYWDADHIVAVADGGGSSPLQNLRTLCLWCHRRTTSEQADRRAGREPPARPSGSDTVRPVVAAYKVKVQALTGAR